MRAEGVLGPETASAEQVDGVIEHAARGLALVVVIGGVNVVRNICERRDFGFCDSEKQNSLPHSDRNHVGRATDARLVEQLHNWSGRPPTTLLGRPCAPLTFRENAEGDNQQSEDNQDLQ